MQIDLERQRQNEQAYWNTVRPQQKKLQALPTDYVQRNLLRPCYEGEGDLYSENRMYFHEIIQRDGGWAGKHVLDYACGIGNWAIYFGSTGASKVTAFDMSAAGVKLGNDKVAELGLQKTVEIIEADATNLPFAAASFDIVIGTGVLHHTIKYPGIFENLYRVMKPGTKAYFSENLADFPLWRLWWKIKGEVPEGDVPIFAREVREKAHMFEKVEIIGDSFVHSAKTVLYKPGMGAVRRGLLRLTHQTDEVLFKIAPVLRRWGSMSVIVLTKGR